MSQAQADLGVLPDGWQIVVEHCSERQWAWRVEDGDGHWVASGCSYLGCDRAVKSARRAIRQALKKR